MTEEQIKIERESRNWVVVSSGKPRGYIRSQSVEANLLFAILEELKKINDNIIELIPIEN